MNLDQLQKSFLRADIIQEGIASLPYTNPRIGKERALRIYTNNYKQTLYNALKISYSELEKFLGDACFKQIAGSYTKKYDSSSQDLDQYGNELAGFIDEIYLQHSELQDYPYLSDLARLEWLLQKSVNAKENKPSDSHMLGNVTPCQYDKLIFQFNQGCYLLTSQYPLHRIWNALKSEAEYHIHEQASNYYFFIYRHQYQAEIENVTEEEHKLLQAIYNKENFSTLGRYKNIQTLLPEWIKKGWIYGTLHTI